MEAFLSGLVDKLLELLTLCGFAGTVLAAFAGPIAIQRFVKPFFDVDIYIVKFRFNLVGDIGTRRRRLTLLTISAWITYKASTIILSLGYDDPNAVLVVAMFVTLLQVAIVEMAFHVMNSRYPALASKFREGIYMGENPKLSTKIAAEIT